MSGLVPLRRRIKRVLVRIQAQVERHGYLPEASLPGVLNLPGTNWEDHFRSRSRPAFFVCADKRSEMITGLRSVVSDRDVSQIIEDADRICRHEFDLLGSGVCRLGGRINWHQDFKTGAVWSPSVYSKLLPQEHPLPGADVKVPWELSRFQHVVTLGKAYWLTGLPRYASEFAEQFVDWHRNNRPGFGVNWQCTMDVAIRVVNLIWGYQFFLHSEEVSSDLHRRFLCSAFEHGRFIMANLERGAANGSVLTSNHFVANVLGLIYLGIMFPEFKTSGDWLRVGLAGLSESMESQVSPDGSDFESSISYHRLVLECFASAALLCRLNEVELPSMFDSRLERMFDYVLHYIRPDGKAPQIGDADDGRLHVLSHYSSWDRRDHRYLLAIGAVLYDRPDMKAQAGGFPEEAFWLTGVDGLGRYERIAQRREVLGSKDFRDAGLFLLRSGSDYLAVTAGRVGTAGVGNHKHNDVLSFELCVAGQPWIVDSGTYVYTANATWRNQFRSTAYHNTVIVDGIEQNRYEPGELFRMSEEANPAVLAWEIGSDADRMEAEHYGYCRLVNPITHRRRFEYYKEKQYWRIRDLLVGSGSHTAEWHFQFDEDVRACLVAPGKVRLYRENAELELRFACDGGMSSDIGSGWVSTRYGVKRPAPHLKIGCRFSSELVVDFYVGSPECLGAAGKS